MRPSTRAGVALFCAFLFPVILTSLFPPGARIVPSHNNGAIYTNPDKVGNSRNGPGCGTSHVHNNKDDDRYLVASDGDDATEVADGNGGDTGDDPAPERPGSPRASLPAAGSPKGDV